MTRNVFQTYHPAVVFTFLAFTVILAMACLHPVYVMLSLAGAFACSVVTRDLRATLLSLRWMVPLVLVIGAANAFLVASGTTELFRLGTHGIYLEALCYGLCQGGMFAAVFLWFASYSACMTSENSMLIFGNVLPATTLMVSQVLRLVPQFVARGRQVAAVQDAVSAAAPETKKEQMAGRLRVVNVLAGWGMEDGLVRGDAMRARGYGAARNRTSYRRMRFGTADGIAIACIALLGAASGFLAWIACGQYAFYPSMSKLVLWWGYLPYLLLMLVPVFLQAKEWLQWRSLR